LNYRVEILSLDEWLSMAKHFFDYSYTHYWEYGRRSAERIGASSEHIAVIDEQGVVIALSNVRIKKLPLGVGGIAYISGGPMVDKAQQQYAEDLLSALVAIQNEYVKNRGFVLRISQRHKSSLRQAQEISIYHKAGFVEFGKTNATILIDLSVNLETIRKGFHPKWRNHLNKSERQRIEIVTGGDSALFDDFGELFKELIAKKSFHVDMDNLFFQTVQQQSLGQEKFHLAIAYVDKKPIAGHLSSLSGDVSVYLLGATNEVGRKLRAAYLLQWHVINESKERGCQWYDLGGIDKDKNPHVFSFKARMGGDETKIGSVFQVYAGFKGSVTIYLEKVYRAVKNRW